ncbi:MAG: hypothetical protein FJY76_02545 [Candidatus Aenigmarchaeota archaeon]|nr:hypothetical protein [Candidatus Aenigmarchaeota archaeon]
MDVREYFDTNLPTVGEIRERYRNPVDLRAYDRLSDRDVADAIMKADRRGLIIPDEHGRYQIWDRSAVAISRGRTLPLDTALRFKRFGPEVDLTRYGTTQTEIRERRLTPRKAMREVLGNSGAREKLLNGACRGVGYWDPRTKTHSIISFDVFPEAFFFERFYGDRMDFDYLFADGYVHVPSVSGEPDYRITLRVFPSTDDFLIEWLMTQANCECKDQFHRGARGKEKYDGFESIFKYSKPERVWCKHTLSALHRAEKLSHKRSDTPPFRVSYPEPTGIINPFYTLKTKTIVVCGNRARRPLKVEDGVLLGKVTGLEGPERMFDLSE